MGVDMPGTNVLDTALGLGFTFFVVAVLNRLGSMQNVGNKPKSDD
jgi:hypothetical protein